MKKILVSIILPTYNGNSKWLSESIDSVLNQTYTNFELIIINDASTNNIEKTILKYQKKESRILYLKNKKNLQLTETLNKGIKISKGKYIARIDDDDIWCDKEKLKKQINFMEQNSYYGLCGTGIILINEKGEELDTILNRGGDTNIRNNISGSNQFAHSSIIIRRSILNKTGYYLNKKYCKYTEDYDLWLRIGIQSKFDNLQTLSVKYRVRKGSISGKKSFIQLSNAFKVYLKYKNYYPNKITGIIKHLITIYMPKFILKLLIKIYNKRAT